MVVDGKAANLQKVSNISLAKVPGHRFERRGARSYR